MATIETDWTTLKNFVTSRKLSLQYLNINSNYYLYAFDGVFSLSTIIPQETPAGADQTDFENNYQSLTTTNNPPTQQVAITLSDNKYLEKVQAFNFSATASSTTTFDYKLTDYYFIREFNFQSVNAVLGDYINIQIVDKDNVLGLGANSIVEELVTKAYVKSTSNTTPIVVANTSAYEVPVPNLYFRVTYTSTSVTTAADVYINLIMYLRN